MKHELRFGQFERARLLDRVLRRDDEERRRRRTSRCRSSPAFLHRLRSAPCTFGAARLISPSEEEVREDRALPHAELVRALVEDLAAEDVRGRSRS
jgi:hypothetical protein